MGTYVYVIEQEGCGCLDLGENLCNGVSEGHAVWVRDMGDNTAHWEGLGRIPSQGGPQADGKITSEKIGGWMGVYPNGGRDDGGGITGGEDLHLLPH